jgi:hypothetical protein
MFNPFEFRDRFQAIEKDAVVAFEKGQHAAAHHHLIPETSMTSVQQALLLSALALDLATASGEHVNGGRAPSMNAAATRQDQAVAGVDVADTLISKAEAKLVEAMRLVPAFGMIAHRTMAQLLNDRTAPRTFVREHLKVLTDLVASGEIKGAAGTFLAHIAAQALDSDDHLAAAIKSSLASLS